MYAHPVLSYLQDAGGVFGEGDKTLPPNLALNRLEHMPAFPGLR